MVEIIVAKHYGLCDGADDSLKKAIEISKKYIGKKIYTFGKLLNNQLIIDYLKKYYGVEHIDVGSYKPSEYNPKIIQKALNQVNEGEVIIITAHGLEKEVISSIRERVGPEGAVEDLTCRKGVLCAQKVAEKFYRKGYGLILITTEKNRFHPETRGIMSHASYDGNFNGFVLTDQPQIYSEAFSEFINNQKDGIGIIAKTTEEKKRFLRISDEIKKQIITVKDYLKVDINEKTICNATRERQSALVDLLNECIDAVVVIGDETSANTRNLAEIAEETNPALNVYLALNWEQVKEKTDELSGFKRIGVTAGASAFPGSVDEVIEELNKL